MSRDFSVWFGACLIEELSRIMWICTCLANSANSSGVIPSLVWLSGKKLSLKSPTAFHYNKLFPKSSVASVWRNLAFPTQLMYMRWHKFPFCLLIGVVWNECWVAGSVFSICCLGCSSLKESDILRQLLMLQRQGVFWEFLVDNPVGAPSVIR